MSNETFTAGPIISIASYSSAHSANDGTRLTVIVVIRNMAEVEHDGGSGRTEAWGPMVALYAFDRLLTPSSHDTLFVPRFPSLLRTAICATLLLETSPAFRESI